jgi:glycosyltransferase involved in cell wall biosynthesis
MAHLSVIVPAYNCETTITECLRALRTSTYSDFEVIVVDDGSRDATASRAEPLADRVIRLDHNVGASMARNVAIGASSGDIVVNIDADVLVTPDTLQTIAAFLGSHPEIDAVTGKLGKQHPDPGFFSQYKNLYMHDIFRRLPSRVAFLYGSVHALRREIAGLEYDRDIRRAHDTALGQHLHGLGKRIAFLPSLEVTHLKRYNALSFLQNDFRIPFDWAKIFVKYRGWKQLGRGSRYAHASGTQLLSVMLAPLILVLAPLAWAVNMPVALAPPVLVWLFLNARFLIYLTRERGPLFGALAVPVTFVDHLVMASGIVAGLVAALAARLSSLPWRRGPQR